MSMSFHKVLNIQVSKFKSSLGGTQHRKSYRSNCLKQQGLQDTTPMSWSECSSVTPQEENWVGAKGLTCKTHTWDGLRAEGMLDQDPGRKETLRRSAFLNSFINWDVYLPLSLLSYFFSVSFEFHEKKKGVYLWVSQMPGPPVNVNREVEWSSIVTQTNATTPSLHWHSSFPSIGHPTTPKSLSIWCLSRAATKKPATWSISYSLLLAFAYWSLAIVLSEKFLLTFLSQTTYLWSSFSFIHYTNI